MSPPVFLESFLFCSPKSLQTNDRGMQQRFNQAGQQQNRYDASKNTKTN